METVKSKDTHDFLEESDKRPLVLITGITGYIGVHVAKQLLEGYSNQYRVRASVRSLSNIKKLEPIKQALGSKLCDQISFVEADLLNAASLRKAIEGVDFIIHIANPVVGTQKSTEEEMVKPAVEGMQTILQAAVEYGVRRIVVTSSMITMLGNVWKRDRGDHYYSEMDYAPYEGSDVYTKSKIAQEAAVRFFIEMQDKDQSPRHKVEVVTLHPSAVFGPTYLNECGGSIEGIVKIMKRDVPGLPDMQLACVDVRDVAESHIRALFTQGLHGHRIIINKGSFSFLSDIAYVLRDEFTQYGYRPQTRKIGFWPLKIASYFDSQVDIVLPMIGINMIVDNKLSKELLGMSYENYSLKDTIIEMGYSLIQQGLVDDLRKKPL